MSSLGALLVLIVVGVVATVALRLQRQSVRETRDAFHNLEVRIAAITSRIHKLEQLVGPPPPPQPGPVVEPAAPQRVAARIPAPAPPPAPASEQVQIPHRPQPAVPRRTGWEIEALIGGNWLLKVGILAIVLGAMYFLKYAFENRWIGDTGRVLIGAAAGLALLAAGEGFQRRGFRVYGFTLAAGGISVLYLAIYAAFNFYSLVPQAPALVLMALVTAAGCTLAGRYRSRTLAVIALLGGLLTPYWLDSGVSREVGLLTYLLILDFGVGWLARVRGWAFLNVISLAGTALLFGGWAAQHYTRGALWTTEFFVVAFAALFVFFGLPRFRKGDAGPCPDAIAWTVAAAAAIGAFVSSHLLLAHNPWYYWAFLLVFTAAAAGFAAASGVRPAIQGSFALTTVSALSWMLEWYEPARRASVLTLSTLVFLVFLADQMRHRLPRDARLGLAGILYRFSAGFGYFALVYSVCADSWSRWMGLFAAVLALVYLGLSRVSRRPPPARDDGALAYLGLSMTLVTLAVPIQFNADWVTPGWAAEALALAWIGLAVDLAYVRSAGLAAGLLALTRLFTVDAVRVPAPFTAVLNGRALVFAAIILVCYLTAALFRRHRGALRKWELPVPATLVLLGGGITVVFVSLEAWTHYGVRIRAFADAFRAGSMTYAEYVDRRTPLVNARQLVLSLLWGAYSIGSVGAGIARRYRPVRIFGIGLFFLAIAKVFAVDIWTLQRLERIVSVITLGFLLLGVAFMYQRFKRLLEA